MNTALSSKQNNLNRTVQTDLENATATTDTGENINPGVTGILPITNGGTGNTTNTSASCSGNAETATKLQTARTINGVSFDGSANITLLPTPMTALTPISSINLANQYKAVLLITSANQGGGNGNISSACFIMGAYYNTVLSVQTKLWGSDNITLKGTTASNITIATHFNVPYDNNSMVVLWSSTKGTV
jgi:hypothetical protein